MNRRYGMTASILAVICILGAASAQPARAQGTNPSCASIESCTQLIAQLRAIGANSPNVKLLIDLFDEFGTGVATSISVTLPSDPLGTVSGRIDTGANLNGREGMISIVAAGDVIRVVAGSTVLREVEQSFPTAGGGEGGGGPAGCDDPFCLYGDPILLDFGAFGFELTSADGGVRFDVDGDGEEDQVAWTRSGSRDAFLVLDRNENGAVDGGQELFGNATPLSDGTTAAHGYMALAECDSKAAGGNGNGVIDPKDRVYGDLQLWVDANHNGASEPAELSSLAERDVIALSFDFLRSMRRDEYGNLFRFLSSAFVRGPFGVRRILTADVFLDVDR